MTEEAANRKRAYQYMVEQVKRLNWSPPIDSDKRLAEALDVPLDQLNSLKEGLSDPSAKIITSFKSLMRPIINETEVDSYLVKPFDRQ